MSETVQNVSSDDSVSREGKKEPPEVNVKVLENKNLPKKSELWRKVPLPIDILLLTVKDCEFLSCLSYLKDDFFKSYHNTLGLVYIGNIGEDETANLKIAVIKCGIGSSGPGGSTVVVKNAARILRPRAVFCVGFCGGLNYAKVKLGDVVVSAKLITYAPTRNLESGIQERGVSVPLKRHLATLIRNVADGWEPPFKNPEELKVTVHRDGVFLSGPELVDNTKRRDELIKRHPQAIAIEMEGEGLYAAAHDLDIEWIVIKGVSDFADGKKTTTASWRPFASVMAASLVAHVLRDPKIFQNWPHYQDASDEEETPTKRKRSSSSSTTDTKRSKVTESDYISVKSISAAAKRRPFFLGSPDVQRPKLPKVKRENPSDGDLERLSWRIAERWKILGRRLNVENQQLIAFEMKRMDPSEKAYRMLQHWKQRDGSAASYRVLHDALAHERVGRKDLATEFCFDFKTSLRAASAGLQAENKVKVELSVKELDTKSESKMMVELSDEDLNTKAESKGEVDLSDGGLGVKSENKVKGELPDEELGTNSGNKANVNLSHEELDTKSGSKIKLEPSDEVLDTKSQSKVKVGQLSVEELNTKSVNMGEVELSYEELGTKSESKIELEPSDEELGTISENKIKVELPVEELDTKSESKANVELLQERQKPDSENRTTTMYNADSEECEICQKGAVWKLQDIQAAAYITFPQNAVTQAVLFRCTRKESTIHSPPLKKDEALVSNVIELSCDDPSASKFTGEFDEKVSVALCHSAANLKGYEVVIRELIDSDNDEWKDLETTNVWQASGNDS